MPQKKRGRRKAKARTWRLFGWVCKDGSLCVRITELLPRRGR